MKKRYIYLLLVLFLIMPCSKDLIIASTIQKEEEACQVEIISTKTVSDELFLFIKLPKEKIDYMTYQIGTSLCKDIKSKPINQLDVAMKTLILVDNSLSIPMEDREKTKDMLLEFIAEKKDNEWVRIATFNEELHYLTDYVNDYTTLKKAIQSIQYNDQETYLTDVLYTVLDSDFKNIQKDYSRIIIISDGVDNKALGYTKEELYAKLEEQSVPIYTFGCRNDNNDEQLKNMFALSRASKANYYLMEQIRDIAVPVGELAADRHIVRLQILPPDNLLDGSIKNSKLTIEQGGREYTLTADVLMPFKVKEEVEVNEPINLVPEKVEEEVPPVKEQKINIYLIYGVAGFVFVAIIGGVVFLVLKKRKSQSSFETISDSEEEIELEEDIEEPTEIAFENQEEMTCRIWNEPSRRTLVLTDINAPSKTFQVPLVDSVIIGRSYKKCNLVIDYDKSISAKHCEIEMKSDNKLFIVDLQSSNGTYVNANRVLTKTEIASGVTIQLGRVEFRLEIR